MNNEKLVRRLNSVGRKVFTEYFGKFQLYATGKIKRAECIELLIKADVGNEAGSARRVSNARAIFLAQKEIKALELVCESKRLDEKVRVEARKLIDKLLQ